MKLQKPLLVTLIALVPLVAWSASSICGDPKKEGRTWTHGTAVLFKSSVLNVDADGAPNSYLVNGKGLSYLCDGVVAIENGKRVTPESDPENWQKKCKAAWAIAQKTNDYKGLAIFGFQTDSNNKPILQADGDPLPGEAYVSTTSVVIPNTPPGTQRQYVDALQIPYIVLSPSFVSKNKVKPGSVAVVYRKKTKAFAFAVFADGGRLGEASVKLHQDLGGNPIVKIAGVDRAKSRIDDATLIVVFPNKVAAPSADAVGWNATIQKEGAAALEEFGGVDQLKKCAN